MQPNLTGHSWHSPLVNTKSTTTLARAMNKFFMKIWENQSKPRVSEMQKTASTHSTLIVCYPHGQPPLHKQPMWGANGTLEARNMYLPYHTPAASEAGAAPSGDIPMHRLPSSPSHPTAPMGITHQEPHFPAYSSAPQPSPAGWETQKAWDHCKRQQKQIWALMTANLDVACDRTQ